MSTFTNSIGQTLEVGDHVVVVAQGYCHSIKIRQGTFIGLSAGGNPRVKVGLEVCKWLRPDGSVGDFREDDVTYTKLVIGRVMTYPGKRVFRVA